MAEITYLEAIREGIIEEDGSRTPTSFSSVRMTSVRSVAPSR